MELDKLINLVNKHLRDEGGIGFPRIVEALPEKMVQQSSDIPEIETEWVWQSMDQFDCYCGEIAFVMDDGRYLMFEFYG